MARAKFRRRLGTVEGLRQRQRGDPAGIGAGRFCNRNIEKQFPAARDELLSPAKNEMAEGRKHAPAEECSSEDLKDELHAALGELFQRTKHRIASIRKYARAEDRRILIWEFRAEMRVAKRDKLLAFREAQRTLKQRRILARTTCPHRSVFLTRKDGWVLQQRPP